jgi:hypothetical protein
MAEKKHVSFLPIPSVPEAPERGIAQSQEQNNFNKAQRESLPTFI